MVTLDPMEYVFSLLQSCPTPPAPLLCQALQYGTLQPSSPAHSGPHNPLPRL